MKKRTFKKVTSAMGECLTLWLKTSGQDNVMTILLFVDDIITAQQYILKLNLRYQKSRTWLETTLGNLL